MINWDTLHGDIAGKATALSTTVRKPTMYGLETLVSFGTKLPARSQISVPVFYNFENDAPVVGTLSVTVPWVPYFQYVLPAHVKGIEVVLGDSCGSTFTLQIDGGDVKIKGEEDLHDTSFDSMKRSYTLGGLVGGDDAEFYVLGECLYTIDVYPTGEFEDEYLTEGPFYYAIAVSVVFVFTAFVFLFYDWAVQLRQNKVLKTATKTQAIVSSLFPKSVQDRIFKDVEEEVKKEEKEARTGRRRGNRTKDQLKNFLTDGTNEVVAKNGPASLKSKPIADLFPEATIIFAE